MLDEASVRSNTNPIRAWCFTVFNPAPDDLERIQRLEHDPSVLRLAVGREKCPETGTPHLQGYVRFSRGLRFTGVRKLLPGAHLEPRGSPREAPASQYALKDGDVLVDKGFDFDPEHTKKRRIDECNEVIQEIESSLSYGQIRQRHKQFVFWYRRYVIDYMGDHKRLKCQSIEQAPPDQTAESGTPPQPQSPPHTP